MFLKLISLFLLCFQGNCFAFESPTKRHLAVEDIEHIKYAFRAKKTTMLYKLLFDKAVANESIGFFGYHGASIDFFIYQDIIRVILEDILQIPVGRNKHFLSPPLYPSKYPATFDTVVKSPSMGLEEITFPLNFSLYANSNRFGLSSIEAITTNSDLGDIPYKQKLVWFFNSLGIESGVLEEIYEESRNILQSPSGVLLQFFDTSSTPYAYVNTIAYPASPSGYLQENKKIACYFLEENIKLFPHELRLLLSIEVLSLKNPISIVRYTKIQASKIQFYENRLREKIGSLDRSEEKVQLYKEALLKAWSAL